MKGVFLFGVVEVGGRAEEGEEILSLPTAIPNDRFAPIYDALV
ncbi:MAG TPA: hypothetical protein VGW38_16630 [Chloroflexota bacterium]|nr:hypothetical protein [Chloroflexota bacterium]